MKRINDQTTYFNVMYIASETPDIRMRMKMNPGMQSIVICTADLPQDICYMRMTVDIVEQIENAIRKESQYAHISLRSIQWIDPKHSITSGAIKIKLTDPYIIPIDSKQVTLGRTLIN